MIELWPSVAEERELELRERAKKWGVAIDNRVNIPWRSNGLFLSIVLFGFTLLALAAMFWLFSEWELPKGLFTAIIALGVAELLILRFRFFGTGVESALWIGGLFAWIFGLSGEAKPEVLLLFAVASAIAGFRVRNPLFGAVAAVFVIVYVSEREWRIAAAAGGVAISLAALLALTRVWQRPSTEMLMIALLIIPPIAGVTAAEDLTAWWAIVFLAAAFTCVFVAVRHRMHAPFIAAVVHSSIAVGILAMHDLLPLRAEWRAIVGGAILLGVAALISRALRGRTRGIVVTPDTLTSFDEEFQLAATLALQPKSETPPPEGPSGGGGRFGGAGSTGEY